MGVPNPVPVFLSLIASLLVSMTLASAAFGQYSPYSSDLDIDLHVDKARAGLNEQVTFTVNVTNHGDYDANEVWVKFRLNDPVGCFEVTEIKDVTAMAGNVLTPDPNDHYVTDYLPVKLGIWLLEANTTQTLTIEGKIRCADAYWIEGVATIDKYGTAHDPTPVEPQIAKVTNRIADLRLSLDATDTTPDPHQQVNITATLANLGIDWSSGIKVKFETDDHDHCFDLAASPFTFGQGHIVGGATEFPFVWQLHAPSNSSFDLTITGSIECGTDFSVWATIIDDGSAVDPTYNEPVHVEIVGPGTADIALTKEFVGFDSEEKIATFVVTAMNMGPHPATNVRIKEIFDANKLIFKDYDATLGQYTNATRIWEIKKLLRGQTEQMVIRFKCELKMETTNKVRVEWLDQFDLVEENDAAEAVLVKFDFGDAEDTYPTTLKKNGARHHLTGRGPWFGSMPDPDDDGQISMFAMDDDMDGNDDEDALFNETPLLLYAGEGYDLTMNITSLGRIGYVSGWVDFNDDGDFEDEREQVFNDIRVSAVAGSTNLTAKIHVPGNAVDSDKTYLRLRICSIVNECNTPRGIARDGEVEDHHVVIMALDFGDLSNPGPATDDGSHRIRRIHLGQMIDAEHEAQVISTAVAGDPNAVGDDKDSPDNDEDGITFLTSIISSSSMNTTASILVEVSGTEGGYLNGWIDYGGNGLQGNALEMLFDDLWVNPGFNLVNFQVLTGHAAGLRSARFRLCTEEDVCDSAYGPAPDGEVEDYTVMVEDGTGMMTVDAFVTTDEQLGFVETDGMYVTVLNKERRLLFKGLFNDLNSLEVNGIKGDDLLTVNATAIPDGHLLVNLGEGHDEMIILPVNATTVKHLFDGPNDGAVDIINGKKLTIDYTGLDPIRDEVVAENRLFQFNGGSESIVIKDDRDPYDHYAFDDGFSFIDSELAEEVTFRNPTKSLGVMGGTGDDLIDYQGLDPKFLPVMAGMELQVLLAGGDGADRILVTPSKRVDIAVEGDLPVMCFGDVLDIDEEFEGAAIYDYMGAGMGTVTWDHYHPKGAWLRPITFNGIEALGDIYADVSIEAHVGPHSQEFYTGDVIDVELTITNHGPDMAQCVGVKDIFREMTMDDPAWVFDPRLSIVGDPSTSPQAFSREMVDPDWVVGTLPVGESITFSAKAIVNSQVPGDVIPAMAMTSTTDPDPWNDVAEIGEIKQTIPFPAGAVAQAALYYEINLGKRVEIDPLTAAPVGDPPNEFDVEEDVILERAIVGLFQGSPLTNTSLLCRIPDPINPWTGIPYYSGYQPEGLGNRWRPCGWGLPYPLTVNDIHLDSVTGDIWVAAWGWKGLYRSSDGGLTFEAVEPNLGPGRTGWVNVYAIAQDVNGFLYISANDGAVFRSMDNGGNWQQVGSLPEVDSDTPWSLVGHPTLPGVIYAGTFGRGVYVSLDYGFTWEFVEDNEYLLWKKAGHIFDLEFDPDGKHLFAATGSGVYRTFIFPETSMDGEDIAGQGDGWSFVPMSDAQDSRVRNGDVEVRDIAFDRKSVLYAATWGLGVYATANPTDPWGDTLESFALRGQQVNFVAVAPSGNVAALVAGEAGLVEFAPMETSTATAVEDDVAAEATLPAGYELGQNYPNPFNPVTTIGFDLPESGDVRLAVYDVLGRQVAILADRAMAAGSHQVRFDAVDLPSGTYIYRLETAVGTMTKTLVLMK